MSKTNPIIKLVFFDIGGVLFDEKGTEVFIQKHHLNKNEFRKKRSLYLASALRGEITIDECINQTLSDMGLSLRVKNYNKFWAKHSNPYPLGHQLLEKISTAFPVGLLTNNMPGSLEQYQRFKLIPDQDYKVIIQSWKVGVKKPDPEIYQIAQQKVQIPPEKILFIDDRDINLNAAAEIGWKTHHFDRNNQQKSYTSILEYLQLTE